MRSTSLFGYVFLILLSGAIAAYFYQPLGLEVSSTFQRLIDAFKYGR